MRFDQNGWLDDAQRRETGNRSQSRNSRQVVVLHYTAGYDLDSAVDHFLNTNADRKASAHFVVDVNGDIVQMVSTEEVAWHAGRGVYRGQSGGFNNKSIGIEIVNPGYHFRRSNGTFENWRRQAVSPARLAPFPGMTEARDPWVSSSPVFWPNFPPEQIEAVENLVRTLLGAYPSIEDIVSHRDVDPIEKLRVDPGPAFPMRQIRMLLADPEGNRDPTRGRVAISANSVLFVRGGPGTGFDKLDWGPLRRDDEVRILARDGNWYKIEHDRDEETFGGWCFAEYIRTG
jgi:N-acetyl-anhydromuramyl-L-alanine amidase AmpD